MMLLKDEIKIITNQYRADYGIFIYDVNNSFEIFKKNESKRYHLASVIKLLVLIEALIRIEEGVLSLDCKIKLKSVDSVPGTFGGMFNQYDEDRIFTVEELLRFMIALSDSVIADYFINLFTPNKINERFKKIGMNDTNISGTILRLNLLSYGFKEEECDRINTWSSFMELFRTSYSLITSEKYVNRAKIFKYDDYNYSTPKDLHYILKLLLGGELLNKELTELAIEILKGQLSSGRIPYMLDPIQGLKVGNQIGTVTDRNKYLVMNDCGFYIDKNNKLIFVYLAAKIEDNFTDINLSFAKITKLVCDSYNR